VRAADREAWEALRAADITSGEPPATDDERAPWYVRTMLGVAGWIGACFFLGFVSIGFAEVFESARASVVVGALLVAAAGAFVGRFAQTDFAAQLGLATSFAGQALLLTGVARSFDWDGSAVWIVIAAIETVLAVLVAQPIHRVWCALAAGGAVWLAFRAAGLPAVGTGVLAAAMAGLWLAELARPRRHALLRESAYGATLALVAVEGFVVLQRLAFDLVGETLPGAGRGLGLGELLVGAVLIFVVWRLCERDGVPLAPRERVAALAAAALVALVSARAPGIAAGLTIVVLGFGNGNRGVVGLGILALVAAVAAYYYGVQDTLLAKSRSLGVLGLVLLGIRALALRWLGPMPESRHA
jgi:hypothetical protein